MTTTKHLELPKPPFLHFILYYEIGKRDGILIFHESDRAIAYIAWSGQGKFQTINDIWTCNKGPIPPTGEIFGQYTVNTIPKHSAEAQGLAFKINPEIVRNNENQTLTRASLRIHYDNGAPGSAGCIVFRKPHEWNSFQNQMKLLRETNILSLPLVVNTAHEFDNANA